MLLEELIYRTLIKFKFQNVYRYRYNTKIKDLTFRKETVVELSWKWNIYYQISVNESLKIEMSKD